MEAYFLEAASSVTSASVYLDWSFGGTLQHDHSSVHLSRQPSLRLLRLSHTQKTPRHQIHRRPNLHSMRLAGITAPRNIQQRPSTTNKEQRSARCEETGHRATNAVVQFRRIRRRVGNHDGTLHHHRSIGRASLFHPSLDHMADTRTSAKHTGARERSRRKLTRTTRQET